MILRRYLAGRIVPANFANYDDDNTLYVIGNDAKEAVDPLKDTSMTYFGRLLVYNLKPLVTFVGNGLMKVLNVFSAFKG